MVLKVYNVYKDYTLCCGLEDWTLLWTSPPASFSRGILLKVVSGTKSHEQIVLTCPISEPVCVNVFETFDLISSLDWR